MSGPAGSPVPSRYIGRFAPSPTGPLHTGSLVAALASYLDARACGGRWLLRIEDIDPPREQPGASDDILRCLEAHRLYWDGPVLYQHQRHTTYQEALAELQQWQLTYYCTCSRQDLPSDGVYPGHCRQLHLRPNSQQPTAIRLDVAKALRRLHQDAVLVFDDQVLGRQQQNLLRDAGDFVIHRKDGLFAYQLAVVVDDLFQGVTHVIRGADLLDSTARQILLFRTFGNREPQFGHVPLVLNRDNQKLSKQNLAPALDHRSAPANLLAALALLGQSPPAALHGEETTTILDWAIRHWAIQQVPASSQQLS